MSEPLCYIAPQGTSVWGGVGGASATNLTTRIVWASSALSNANIEASSFAIDRWK